MLYFYSHKNSLRNIYPNYFLLFFFCCFKQWTTDQDITDAVNGCGINDFQEVKFFENRANGQSKGFCVITLGSESSMRQLMDRLPKSDLHGQKPIVTLPTKQALNQFESQQKTRPIPPSSNLPRGQPPMQGGPMQGGNFNQQHPPRMMMPNGPPGYRPPHMPPQNMQGMGPNQGPPRMQVDIHELFQFIYYLLDIILSSHRIINLIKQNIRKKENQTKQFNFNHINRFLFNVFLF